MASFSPLDNYRSGHRGMTPTGIVIDKSCRVYVTQIPLERIERDGANAMKAEFEVYGPLESYKMFTDRSGRFVGSALCTYRNPADASMAIYCMDGVEVEGTTLHVQPAKEHGVVLLSGSSSSGDGTRRDRSHGFLPDTRWQSVRGGHGGATWLNARRGSDAQSTQGGTGAEGEEGSVHGHPHGSATTATATATSEEEQAEALRSAAASADDGKWSHDKYEMIAEGRSMDEVLGLRRPKRGMARGRGMGGVGGMGRGGRMGGQGSPDHVSMAFEKYISERDATVDGRSLAPPPAYGVATGETASTAVSAAEETINAASNADMMNELAFGEDQSTEPVVGKELGALEDEAKAE